MGNITNFDYYPFAYDEAIRYMDKQINQLVKGFYEFNLTNRTIIMSADHGESMGEHNIFFTHGFSLNDVELNIHKGFIYTVFLNSNEDLLLEKKIRNDP